MIRKRAILGLGLVLCVCSCGAVSQIAVIGKELKVTEDFTKQIEDCRSVCKRYIEKNYEPNEMREQLRINDDQKSLKMYSDKVVRLKYACDSRCVILDASFTQKLQTLVYKHKRKLLRYEKQMDERMEVYSSDYSDFLASFVPFEDFSFAYLVSAQALGSRITVNESLCDFKGLFSGDEYTKFKYRIYGKMRISNDNTDGKYIMILDFTYYYTSPYIRMTTEPKVIGRDKVIIVPEISSSRMTLQATQQVDLKYANIVKLGAILELLKRCSVKDILENIKSFNTFIESSVDPLKEEEESCRRELGLIKMQYDENVAKIDRLKDELRDKDRLLSDVRNREVYCSMLSKDLTFFEAAKDVKITKVSSAFYKKGGSSG
ncbi:MAG: hypothetical protein U5R49_19080 [Deltaproteobacteria bacterium]|nr:hypothetical protein [Deltaproteobacteria bacterium]